MKRERRSKNFISLISGVAVVIGSMSMSAFADGQLKTVGGFRLDGSEVQYIFFGKVPNNDKYFENVKGSEIMWKINDSRKSEGENKDILSMSIKREKIKSNESDNEISDCFSKKEEKVISDKDGEITEVIERVKKVHNSIKDKLLNMFRETEKCIRKEDRININIPVSNIIYKTSGNSRGSDLGVFKAVKNISANKNKLTIIDETRALFKVDEDEVEGLADNEIMLNYHNVVSTYKQGKEYISAIIKNTEGDAQYYGKFLHVCNEEGTVSIKLPSDIGEGEYELMILTEQENGAKKTNYAGFDIVKLVVKK